MKYWAQTPDKLGFEKQHMSLAWGLSISIFQFNQGTLNPQISKVDIIR